MQSPLEPQVVPTFAYHALLRVPYWRLSECECAPNEWPVEPTRPRGQRSHVFEPVLAFVFVWSCRKSQPLPPATET
jgi:hypothetical protein